MRALAQSQYSQMTQPFGGDLLMRLLGATQGTGQLASPNQVASNALGEPMIAYSSGGAEALQVAVPADVDNQTNWDYLTSDEKAIACNYFVVGKEDFFLEVVNDLRHWTVLSGEHRRWTMEARSHRAELAESILFMRMQNLPDAKQCMADLHQIAKDTVIDIDDVTNKVSEKVRVKSLSQQYVEGLEDEANDGVVAVRDWVSSTVGTPYESNGFMNLSYPLKGTHTSASVRDEILSALDGEY